MELLVPELAFVTPTRREFEFTLAMPASLPGLPPVDRTTDKFLNALTVEESVLDTAGIDNAIRQACCDRPNRQTDL